MRKRIDDLRGMKGFEVLDAVTLGRGMSSPNDPRPALYPSVEVIKEVKADGHIWRYDIEHNDIFTRVEQKKENDGCKYITINGCGHPDKACFCDCEYALTEEEWEILENKKGGKL